MIRMDAEINQRCAHPACGCQTRVDDPYCSDYCRQKIERPGASAGAPCECGHAPCRERQAHARNHHRPIES